MQIFLIFFFFRSIAVEGLLWVPVYSPFKRLFVLPRNFTMKIKREQRKYNIRPVGAINPSYIMKSLKTSSFTS